jgi:nicotinamide-nucleotide adenylyltransferase
MCIFAKDLIDSLQSRADLFSIVPVDIGVTTVPYYTDKSAVIESEGSEWYPTKPKHIHLVGFDTLTRFFAAKYYQKFSPPFSALNPYFDGGHRLRVSLRPDDDYGDLDYQKGFLNELEGGKLEAEGAKREWTRQIDLVDPNPEAGVSSTKIRRAAKRGDWDEFCQLTTPNVAAWIRSESLYADDDTGAKMA